MAKKGILSDPPKKQENLTRVSPGVYKDSRGNIVHSAQGGQSSNQGRGKDKQPRGYQSKYLGRQEENLINQQMQNDASLGGIAQGMIPGLEQTYGTPMDWSNVASIPGAGDFEGWRNEQIGKARQNFETANSQAFKQQMDDFDQQMANRGIPMGSSIYNQEKSRLEKSQNDARLAAESEAYNNAGNQAAQFAGVGNQAFQNTFGFEQAKRGQGLSEYGALMGAQSGMPGQAYDFGNRAWLQQNAPRGGSFAPPGWQQAGFGSYQDYVAFEDARDKDKARFNQGLQPKAPSQGSQLLNTAVPALIGGWASTW